MAKESVHEAELWLPSEFVYDDLALMTRQDALQYSSKINPVSVDVFASNPESPVTESDEEDHMAGLTQRMTHSFLLDDDETSWSFAAAGNEKVGDMAGSPQSTLCDWQSSKKGSPDGPSLVSSPPLLSPGDERQWQQQQQPKEDPWVLLSEAAGQVMRLRLNEAEHSRGLYHTGLLGAPGKSSAPKPVPCKAGAGYYRPSPTFEQLRAAQFYRLKQLQMMKQQQQKKQSAPWGKLSKPRYGGAGGSYGGTGGGYGEGRCSNPLGLSPSAWPPLHKHQQASPKQGSGDAIRTVFLDNTRKDSVGTGVFIPRHADNMIDPPSRKKPACSTFLVPARVVQALNLNLEELGAEQRFHGTYALDQAALAGRSMSHQKSHQRCPRPAAAMAASAGAHELLPPEWTY